MEFLGAGDSWYEPPQEEDIHQQITDIVMKETQYLREEIEELRQQIKEIQLLIVLTIDKDFMKK